MDRVLTWTGEPTPPLSVGGGLFIEALARRDFFVTQPDAAIHHQGRMPCLERQ